MATATPTTDRIEQSALLRAPPSRVWKLLTERESFGRLFNIKLEREFATGTAVRGTITHPQYAGVPLDLTVERLDPEKRFSWHWHPGGVERGVDTSKEPTTMVAFTLEPSGESTRLSMVEYGFDRLPAARRDKARDDNAKGWTEVFEAIEHAIEKAK